MQKLSERKGDLLEMRPSGGGRTRMVFHVPTRGLLGYQAELLSDTRGTGDHEQAVPRLQALQGRDRRAPHRRADLEQRTAKPSPTPSSTCRIAGRSWSSPQTRVYEGMIVGEHTRDNDLEVNVVKGKKLTNVRASGKDEACC